MHVAFQGQLKAHQTPRKTKCFTHSEPLLQAICSSGCDMVKRKENAFQNPPLQGHSWLCHHRISTSQLGNVSPIAFRSMKQSMHAQICPAIQDRLTHVQAVFTWNHSPLQSSKLSFEYLLLPPRSAATAIPPKFTLRLRHKLLHPPTHHLNMFKRAARYQSHA